MNLNADPNLLVTRRSKKDMPMNMTPPCGSSGWSRHSGPKRLALLIALAMTALPLAAQAQRKSPLADAPAIRKRFELRSTRLELGAGFGSTLNQDFYHTEFFNVKAGFHITDWLSLSGFAGFAVANLETTFQSNLVGSLSTTQSTQYPNQPTPMQAQGTMEKINSLLGVQLEFTPFAGKYSLFGKLFANYDFYVFGGPGFINVKPTDATLRTCDTAPSASIAEPTRYGCTTSGLKPGANFGLGLHSFFNQWLALNVELRDILAQLNPSGRDANGDGKADTNDLSWSHTYMLTANLVVYLPSTAHISP